MDAITDFSLKSITEDTSQLFQGSSETPITLNGSILEGQWLLNTGWYLLCVSENCPYEEALHFILLNETLSKRDELILGRPYTPGIFDNIQYLSKNTISFSFESNTRYTLTVHNEGISMTQRFLSKGHRKNSLLKKSFLFMEEAK